MYKDIALEAIFSDPGAPSIALQKDYFVDHAKISWGHCETIIDLTPLHSPQSTGLFINETWVADECMFTQRALDGNSHIHEAKHIPNSGNMLFVSRFLTGHSIGRSGDTPYSIYPGSIAMRDYSRPFDGIQTAGVAQGVYFLHETLGFRPGDNPCLRVFHENTAIAQTLHAEFDTLFAQLSTGDTHISKNQLERIKSCILLAVHHDCEQADARVIARDALKRTICMNIERNLTDPTYGVNTILAHFGVSRSTLFRMFEADGGVRNYISNRRLYRAVLQISKTPMTRGLISNAAYQWGFSAVANFSRSVRRAFGTSPNSLFEAPIQHLPAPKGSRAIWAEQRTRLMQSAQETMAHRQHV